MGEATTRAGHTQYIRSLYGPVPSGRVNVWHGVVAARTRRTTGVAQPYTSVHARIFLSTPTPHPPPRRTETTPGGQLPGPRTTPVSHTIKDFKEQQRFWEVLQTRQ